MAERKIHYTHPALIKRLKRVTGHLQNVIKMMEGDRSCLDIAQQMHAIERAIAVAKKVLIHDHLDHCLENAVGTAPRRAARESIDEFKEITKYL